MEALRLGCETYSSDINPVAIIIQKCIMEFPQCLNRAPKTNNIASIDNSHDPPLLNDIRKWSDWVLSSASKEIGRFYPSDVTRNETVIGYITARMITCQNLRCKAEIPLMPNFWLSHKQKKMIAVYPYLVGKTIRFKIVGDGHEPLPHNFDPDKGTISRATAVCIGCGSVVDPKTLKKIFWDKHSWERQIVTIVTNRKNTGKFYRLSSKRDFIAFESACQDMEKNLHVRHVPDIVPTEIISTPNNREYKQNGLYWRDTASILYGITKYKDLFNSRQLLAMVTFTKKIKIAYDLMLDSGYDPEYAKAIATYLGIMLDRLADKNSNLARYHVGRETIESIFGRQALSMIWHYVELNPFSDNGWKNMLDWVLRVIQHCSTIERPATITLESAMSISYPDSYFDAVFTDPPYYDNIQYSLLSDFYYVWLKRSVGHLYPELFSTPLTPKSNEIIADASLVIGSAKQDGENRTVSVKSKNDFERMLSSSFAEIHRVLKNDGIAIIVYAHKSTDGWETLINSILESGLVITASWPIYTEMQSRMIAKESAALRSSIYMVARKVERIDLAFYRDIKSDLSTHVTKKLTRLWDQGVSGTDFFISAIGISMEVFARYKKVLDDNDVPITALNLLDDVRKIVTDFAIKQALHSDFGHAISPQTRFYISCRVLYKHTKVPFDDALKIARSVGLDIERECGSFVHKEKGYIKVMGPSERKIEDIESNEMIDVLHKSMLLWKNNRRDDLLDKLKKSGHGGSDVFYRVAQAISESDPGSEESKLLDGFLSAKDRIQRHMMTLKPGQTKLL